MMKGFYKDEKRETRVIELTEKGKNLVEKGTGEEDPVLIYLWTSERPWPVESLYNYFRNTYNYPKQRTVRKLNNLKSQGLIRIVTEEGERDWISEDVWDPEY